MFDNLHLPPSDQAFAEKLDALLHGIKMEFLENPDFCDAMCRQIPALNMLVQGFFALKDCEDTCPAPALQSFLNFKGMEGLFEFLGCRWMEKFIQPFETALEQHRIPTKEEGGRKYLLPFGRSRGELKRLNETSQTYIASIQASLNKKFTKLIISNLNLVIDCFDPQNIHTEELRSGMEEMRFLMRSFGTPLYAVNSHTRKFIPIGGYGETSLPPPTSPPPLGPSL
ncbi:MAG: hypothetical protein V1746_05995 [bacterium]